MDQFKKAASMLLNPRPWVFVPLMLFSYALLGYVFMTAAQETPIAYVSYCLCTYTLVITAAGIPKTVLKTQRLIYRHKAGERYMTDPSFRMLISLYFSLGINLINAVFNLYTGLINASPWFGAVGVYYGVLSIVRFVLLSHVVAQKDINMEHQFRQYRRCGYWLFATNLSLTGMVVQMVRDSRVVSYPGYLIYAAAAYAFYTLTFTLITLFKYRKLNRPDLSAGKAINLTSALVSMFSLQTAMFAAFGSDPLFQRILNIVTGSLVCISILCIAVIMVVRANRELDKYHEQR